MIKPKLWEGRSRILVESLGRGKMHQSKKYFKFCWDSWVVLIAETKVKIYRLLLLRVSGQAVPRSSIEWESTKLLVRKQQTQMQHLFCLRTRAQQAAWALCWRPSSDDPQFPWGWCGGGPSAFCEHWGPLQSWATLSLGNSQFYKGTCPSSPPDSNIIFITLESKHIHGQRMFCLYYADQETNVPSDLQETLPLAS